MTQSSRLLGTGRDETIYLWPAAAGVIALYPLPHDFYAATNVQDQSAGILIAKPT